MAPTLMAMLPLLLATARAEVFSSTAHLSRVLSVEGEVVQLLREFVDDTERKLFLLRRYIEDFEHDQIEHERQNDESPVGDPLRAYHLMKRLTIDWSQVDSVLGNNVWSGLQAAVTEKRQALSMPQDDDLQGAALALIRLQETYGLNASDLARGEILGLRSSVGLTARDCLFLGKHSFHAGFLDLAVEWYDHAISVAHGELNATAGVEEIRPFLDQAIRAHDEAIETGGNKHTFHEPVAGKAPAQLKRDILQETTFRLGAEMTYDDDNRNYRALCRGQRLRPPAVEARLACYLSDRGDPYFRLHPVKVEENSADPYVYTFYDIISDNEIESIKTLARPQLERSTVISLDGAGREISNVRTSQNAWLFDHNADESHALFNRVMARVGWITGLYTVGEGNAEALQVANYGIGGHYIPHHDYIIKDKTPEQLARIGEMHKSSGDRIATFMFYLSDVARGGATVFPRIGAAVWPTKGAAVFWYNLLASGELDTLTLHGACPVIHGSKWVGNKWIREMNQTFNRPCGLSP